MKVGTNQNQNRVKKLPLKSSLFLYLFVVATIIIVSALGDTSDNLQSYYNTNNTTPWWSPQRILFAFVFVATIPLPHILISLLFKTKRSWISVLKIARGWNVAIILGLMAVIAYSTYQRLDEDFCSTLMENKSNQEYLSQIYRDYDVYFKGDDLMFLSDSPPFKVYQSCLNNNSQYQCWSDLVNTEHKTYREIIDYQLSVGKVLHECKLKLNARE